MDISVSHRDGHLVWELRGDLDFEGACALRTAAKSCEAVGALVIDLDGVPFVDSAGLAALIGLSRRVSESGGRVVVSRVRRPVRRLLRITGVDRRLEIADAEDDDVEAPAPGAASVSIGASRW